MSRRRGFGCGPQFSLVDKRHSGYPELGIRPGWLCSTRVLSCCCRHRSSQAVQRLSVRLRAFPAQWLRVGRGTIVGSGRFCQKEARGGPARIRAGLRSRAGNSSGSTGKYVAGGTLMQMLDRRRQCAGRREQQPRPEQRVREIMDIAGGVPKVRQSLPKVAAIGDLAPLMQSVMCHIGHCHAPVLLRLRRIGAMGSWLRSPRSEPARPADLFYRRMK